MHKVLPFLLVNGRADNTVGCPARLKCKCKNVNKYTIVTDNTCTDKHMQFKSHVQMAG